MNQKSGGDNPRMSHVHPVSELYGACSSHAIEERLPRVFLSRLFFSLVHESTRDLLLGKLT